MYRQYNTDAHEAQPHTSRLHCSSPNEGRGNPPSILYRNKQLLNNIVDGMAQTRPSAICAEVPRSSDSYGDGYRKVTYGALANAVNGKAWSLKGMLGEGQNHQTLAYIGPNELGICDDDLRCCEGRM